MGNEDLKQPLEKSDQLSHGIEETGPGVAVDRISCRNLLLVEKKPTILDENTDFSPIFVRPIESIEAAHRKNL
jgi:hypothetical protein